MPTQTYLREAEIHSSAAVFAGTRVAVWVMFNWLAAGKTLNDFIEAHPQVERAAALAALDEASRSLVGVARCRRERTLASCEASDAGSDGGRAS